MKQTSPLHGKSTECNLSIHCGQSHKHGGKIHICSQRLTDETDRSPLLTKDLNTCIHRLRPAFHIPHSIASIYVCLVKTVAIIFDFHFEFRFLITYDDDNLSC